LAFPVDDNNGRQHWLDELESRCEKVAVHSEDYNVPLSLTCIAVSAESAEQIERAFGSYSTSFRKYPSLVSPWSPDHQITAEQNLARKTTRLLEENVAPDAEDTRPAELYKKQAEARRRGDQEAVKALQAEVAAIYRERKDKHIQTIRDRDDVDQHVIEIYAREPQFPVQNAGDHDESESDQVSPEMQAYIQARKDWSQQMAVRLGQLPLTDGMPTPEAKRFGLVAGGASRAGLILRFDNLNFHRHVDGIPAFVDWLCSQECVDFNYRLSSWEDQFEGDGF
jgi:hypothetical protein